MRVSVRLPLAAAFLAALLAALPRPAAPASPELPGFGGRFAFRTYGEEDGLGNLTVECLLQDHAGFLWVGTQDGLYRFDGRRFLHFGRDEGLPSSRINALHETAGHRLYAGTRDGLAVLAGERFQPLGPEEGLPRISIPDEGIASDSAGTLYVATPRGLYLGRGDRFREEPAAPGLPPEVTGLHVTREGALVFARSGRLFRRAGGRTEEIGAGQGLPAGERIDETATDAAGRFWVRTLSHLLRRDPGNDRFVGDDAGLPAGVGTGRLALDDRGELLVPTARGLARREAGGWRRMGQREGLEVGAVVSALVDREGSLWIGLAGVGLVQQLGRGAFTAWGTPEGLSHDVVWAIARDAVRQDPGDPGALWVGTEEGLDRLDLATGAVRIWRQGEGLGANTVYSLAADPGGGVWAGTWGGGVARFGPGPGEVRPYGAEGHPAGDLRVSALYRDRSGALWAGASDGAYRLDERAAPPLFRPVRLPGWDARDSVYGFAEDRSGTLWAVGRYGLQRLTGPSPRRFRMADGLLADFLSAVTLAGAGEPGDLIVGYREALGAARLTIRGDHLQVTPIDVAAGLSSDKVLLLGHDAGGALWVGGASGVDVFRRPGEPPVHFGRAEGLLTEDMSQNAFAAEPDGTVWLGTSRGLLRYRPGLAPSRPLPPPVLLTEVRAGGRRLDPAAGPVVLGRGERNLAVAWASPTFLDPKKVRFRYRLAGLDEGWSETFANEARFSALPTGRYRLEVEAEAGSGPHRLTSPQPAIFAFSVLPAWWERWWARAVALLLLALAVAGAVRLRTRALEADRRRLEQAVAERSAALAAAVRDLREASFTDPLTGVRNRRFLNAAIAEEGATGGDLVAYLIDIDHFKAVNDLHGHHAGDLLLVQVAARLSQVVRQGDLLIRWGGEEFLLVARAVDRGEAPQLAGRILESLGGSPFDIGGRVLHRTCSVGWAPFPWFPEAPGELRFEQVLTLADHALYLAKGSGRNRAVGALPLGRGAEVAARHPGWWQQPLAEGEGRWAVLLRTPGPAAEPVAAQA